MKMMLLGTFLGGKSLTAGFDEYNEILGTVCHNVTSKGLGKPDHVRQETLCYGQLEIHNIG